MYLTPYRTVHLRRRFQVLLLQPVLLRVIRAVFLGRGFARTCHLQLYNSRCGPAAVCFQKVVGISTTEHCSADGNISTIEVQMHIG